MNRLDQLFLDKKENLLAIYFTAGFPEKNSLTEIISALNETDTDIIEIGIPFSDPMADGEVIQYSSKIALQNGIDIPTLFQQLDIIKGTNTKPLVIMTYFNPVFTYGFEKFCQECSKNEICGLIIPDLPLVEYENKYKELFKKYQLTFTPLVSPTTSIERIKTVCEAATGFLYMVTQNQTTGSQNLKSSEEELKQYSQRIKQWAGKKPVLMGFGIDSASKYQQACDLTNGGIIGSAYIKLLEKNPTSIRKATKIFIDQIKAKTYDYSIEK